MNTNGSQVPVAAATLALMPAVAVPAQADGLVAALPDDGAYCRFRLTTRVEAGRGTEVTSDLPEYD